MQDSAAVQTGIVPPVDVEVARLRRELDLYRQLLDLGRKDEIEPFLEEALALIVDVAGARRGYLELHDDQEGQGGVRFWIARGCSEEDVAEIRAAFSAGVIAEALATGKTICTASALLDPRFRDRGSVRRNRIEAVLCAPIGASPPLGVIYLQDRLESGPFSEEDQIHAETFAGHLAAFADRLLIRRRDRDEADPTLPFRQKLRLDGLVGRSAALAKVLKQVAVAAPVDAGVLLSGPSGTGKTQIARILHDNGPRAAGPFVELNCANLTEALLESELFGALPGAHSTANRRVDGKLTAAQGGTLFLDEIGEIPLASQAKLLKLLDSKEFYPLGSAKPVRADVRVVAATNVDLKSAVTRREFREDLFYRLQVLPIRVPPLAERREDIPLLVRYFCDRLCESQQRSAVMPSQSALRAAQAAEWPGNIRELTNAVQRAVLLASMEGLAQFERVHLFPDDDAVECPATEQLTFQQATRRFQAQLVLSALDRTAWNITETAAVLDVTRSHVYNLIRAFGIERRTR
ncbi:sigma 54-interacting transcriptional regulator [Sorangium sp. So ce448]|uniref:sigma 54-interacting transcriptional regulator n=1 Tax=Sorangium sp. So ce448 TaxID=3133314 RepID=UPI003F6308BF